MKQIAAKDTVPDYHLELAEDLPVMVATGVSDRKAGRTTVIITKLAYPLKYLAGA